VPTAIRRRYAVKFGIALLILGLSVGLIGYGATAGITNQVEDRVQTDHASSASQEAQSLQMWNEQNEHTVGTMVRSDVVASDDPQAIQQRFLDWQEHLDTDTFDISYVDIANETVTASTNEAYRDVPTSEFDNVPSEAYTQSTASVRGSRTPTSPRASSDRTPPSSPTSSAPPRTRTEQSSTPPTSRRTPTSFRTRRASRR